MAKTIALVAAACLMLAFDPPPVASAPPAAHAAGAVDDKEDVAADVAALVDGPAADADVAAFRLECYGSAFPDQVRAAIAARPDLPGPARERLAGIVAASDRRFRKLSARRDEERDRGEYYHAVEVAVLDRYPAADRPKWYAAARLAVDRRLDWDRARTKADRAAAAGPMVEAYAAVVDQGCDDPNILTPAALAMYDNGATDERVLNVFLSAEAGRKVHPAAPVFAVTIDGRLARAYRGGKVAVRGGGGPTAVELAKAKVDDMATVVADLAAQTDPTPPAKMIVDAASNLTATTAGDPDATERFEAVAAVIDRTLPNNPAALLWKGKGYVDLAWAARGSGWAGQVTPEGNALFVKRLATASEVLERAWQADPTQSAVADVMIRVQLGQDNGRPEMEKWFDRAMTADPDDQVAPGFKMLWLEPKWHGSPAEMIAFGRECAAGGNWYARVTPLQIVGVHMTLAKMTADPVGYFAQPAVWADVGPAMADDVRYYPEDEFAHSLYACLASKAGHWAIADAQFKAAGEHLRLTVFDTPAQAAKFKAEAARHANGE